MARQHQFLASFLVNALALVAGAYQIAPSIILPSLLVNSHDSPQITLEEGSCIASMSMLGAVFGSMLCGWLVDVIGRKKCLIFDCVLYFISVYLQSWSFSAARIGAGRFIIGWLLVSGRISIHPFVAEISTPENRVFTSNGYMLMFSIGMTIINLCGALLNWRIACSIPLIFVLIAFIGLQFIHESPHWLIQKGEYSKALDSFMYYGRTKDEAQFEFLEYKDEYESKVRDAHGSKKPKDIPLMQKWSHNLRRWKEPGFYKPLIYLCIYGSLIELSSMVTIVTYMVIIFQKTGSPFDPYFASTLICFIRIFATLIGTKLMHQIPKRDLFVAVGSFTVVVLASLGFFCWISSPEEKERFACIPLILISLIFVGFSLGYGTIFHCLMGELFLPGLKSLSSAIVYSCVLGTSFVIVKYSLSLIELLEIHGLFWLFAGVTSITTLHGWFFMPETTGKSLQEILKYYSCDKSPKATRV
ncbi:trehalose transporter 1-like protein [Lepeophtheirus salmonis]|uniref:trehalose transporter 1-like protein n=1 Tax=Lepeophtheirus salmonis TaxID=72036 RepID=UPI001AE5FD94|nr:facilitated trehalose transporter Tret1-2 homolog [Lepeophtheirus salmonis]